MSSRGEEEEQRGEERGKGEEQSELDEGFICRMTCSTGSWHKPGLKVLEGAKGSPRTGTKESGLPSRWNRH